MKYSYSQVCSLKGWAALMRNLCCPSCGTLASNWPNWTTGTVAAPRPTCRWTRPMACVLAARNLAIAEKAGPLDLLTPCSACYLVLNRPSTTSPIFPDIKATVQRALGSASLTYTGSTKVRHPLDVLIHDVGLDVIKEKVVRPLKD